MNTTFCLGLDSLLANLAEQTPSVPLYISIEYLDLDEPPVWSASVSHQFDASDPVILAEGIGPNAGAALEQLRHALERL